MLLIVGLGNPGLKYQFTKHNFGFLLFDQLIKDYKLSFQKNKFNSQFFSGNITEQKIIAIKPQNYINLSGSAVQSMMNFYKIPIQNVIILHDDLDLPLGKVKAKIGGGSAGHKGIQDIDRLIGKNYIRIRLGVDRPQNPQYQISDYILSKFNDQELEMITQINNKISKLFPLIINNKLDDFMNKFALMKA